MACFGFPVFPYRTTGGSFRSAGAGDAICREQGLLRGRGKQCTNSTPILAAIRTLNRLELVGDTVRFTSNRLAAVALAWLQTHLQPVWLERYRARVENYRLPKTETSGSGWPRRSAPMDSPCSRPSMHLRLSLRCGLSPESVWVRAFLDLPAAEPCVAVRHCMGTVRQGCHTEDRSPPTASARIPPPDNR